MKSFHIILKNHKLGEELGYKNIDIAKRFGIDAKIFDGVPGDNCKHIFKEHKIINGFRGISGIGQRGCFLSHFLLWQKCIELNSTIAILEHDGVFLRPLPADIEDNFEDICRLEAFRHWDADYETQTELSLANKVMFERPPTEFCNPITGKFYVGYYGYLIKPSGAEKLIKHAKAIGAIPVDMFVGTNIVDIVSVTASIIRLDPVYIGKVTELSTTYNFNNALNG
jgi:GR25 family glycosyltransferase involved in LPS biosynthesis